MRKLVPLDVNALELPDPPSEEAIDARLHEMLSDPRAGLLHHAEETHTERCEAWRDRVYGSQIRGSQRGQRGPGVFDVHRELVARHFGVDIWSSNVRLGLTVCPWSPWKLADTTITYLTMPINRIRSERWSVSRDEDTPGCESGYGVPVALAQRPAGKSLRRLARAMQILDLGVFVHPSQRGQILAPPSLAKRADENEEPYREGAWPQLTLLTRNTPHW